MKKSEDPFYQSKRLPYTKRTVGTLPPWPESFEERVRALEVKLLTEALTATNGSTQQAADLCGLGRSTFCFKMNKYALSAKGFK